MPFAARVQVHELPLRWKTVLNLLFHGPRSLFPLWRGCRGGRQRKQQSLLRGKKGLEHSPTAMAILRHGPLMQSANIYIHHIFSHYNHLYKSTAITMIDKHAQITLQMPLLKLANVSVKSQKAQPFLQKRRTRRRSTTGCLCCSHRAHFGRFLKASRLAWRRTSRRPWGQGWEARGKTSISCETSSNFHIV